MPAHSRKSIELAIAVLEESVRELSPEDRAGLSELFQLLLKETDEDERLEIIASIAEVLTVSEYPATTMDPKEPELDEPCEFTRHCSEKIKKLRLAAGWSQTELAEKSGIPQSYISRIESAQHAPTHKTLKKLASSFRVDLGELDPTF